MKAILFATLASALAWAESLPPDFQFLLLLPFGVMAIAFAGNLKGRLRGRGARGTRRGDTRRGFDPWATPRASSLLTLRHAARRHPRRSRSRF